MFNVSKQLCFFLAQGYYLLPFSTRGSARHNCTTLLKRSWSAPFLVSKKPLPRAVSHLGRSVVHTLLCDYCWNACKNEAEEFSSFQMLRKIWNCFIIWTYFSSKWCILRHESFITLLKFYPLNLLQKPKNA